MRKLFIATLLLTIGCGTPAFAATQCESIQADTCDDTAGCYLEVNNNTCQPCPAGTYKGSDDPSCLPCGDNVPVTWNKNTTGLTSQSECAYTTTCQAYHYFGGYTTGCALCSASNDTYYYGTKTTEYEVTGTVGDDANNFNDACDKCGNNSKTNEQGNGCQCIDGYHVQGGPNENTNNNSTNCDPNEYTITYIANNGTDLIIKRDATFDASIKTLKSDDDNRLVYPGYTLSAWKNDDEKLYIFPGNSFTYNILGNLELTAVWAGKEFTVTYNVGAASCSNLSDQTCRYNDQNCKAQDVESCQYSGHVFRGWQCTSGCENSNKIINLGDDISRLSDGEDMTLSAIWAECPAGYYCPNIKTENKCPAGSTSAAKSAEITNCYMTGGTTKICDKNNKCFMLPATVVGNIFYHGTQQ